MDHLLAQVEETAHHLKQNYSLTEFEALQIAVQIQKNHTIRLSFGVTHSDDNPTFLEAIAMALGYGDNLNKNTESIAESIDSVFDAINELSKCL